RGHCDEEKTTGDDRQQGSARHCFPADQRAGSASRDRLSFVPPSASYRSSEPRQAPGARGWLCGRGPGPRPPPHRHRASSQGLGPGRSATGDGAWGSAAALLAAALARQTTGTLLIVLAHPRDVDGWAADLGTFAGISPLLFPAWDNLPAPGESNEATGQRLR